MKTAFKVEGLRELDAALGALASEYGKPAGKAVLRRTGIQALQPMAEAWRGMAPDDPQTSTPDYKTSIIVGTKLNKRQAALARKDQNKSTVTVYVGTNDPAGVQLEFGNAHQSPQPSARPAFEQEARPTIDRVGELLGPEIEKTAARLAKRRAAKAARAA